MRDIWRGVSGEYPLMLASSASSGSCDAPCLAPERCGDNGMYVVEQENNPLKVTHGLLRLALLPCCCSRLVEKGLLPPPAAVMMRCA